MNDRMNEWFSQRCLLTRHESRVTSVVRGPCSVPCAASPSGSSFVCLDNKPVCHNQLDDQMGVLREPASGHGHSEGGGGRRETRREGRIKQGTTPGPEKEKNE